MDTSTTKTHLVILTVFVVALGVGAFLYSNAFTPVPGISARVRGMPSSRVAHDPSVTKLEDTLSEEACAEAGGSWNPCASACPDAGSDAPCIQVCVARCEAPKSIR